MKIIILFAMLVLGSLNCAAENKGILYLKSPANYQVLSISQNGEWACGVQYDENSDTNFAFRWNLLTGKIEDFGEGMASSISNDGTVAGSYYDSGKEIGGIWNGSWTALEKPSNYGYWAQAISPDGRYVTGTDNKYKSYIWKDGKIENRITLTPVGETSNGTFITYAISPDGQKAGGWAYYHDDNRNPGYWDAADQKFHDLEPSQGGSPWQTVRKFSADSKKALYWGGYHNDNEEGRYGIHAIYNTETGDVVTIFPTEDDPFNFDLYDMNDDASLVLGYEQDGGGSERAIIWDGETKLAEDYLSARGANTEYDDVLMYFRSVATSGDGNTLAILYYDSQYNYHSMIFAFDRETSMTPPVNLEVKQVVGMSVVDLNWGEPLGDKETLEGYNVYRDGVKINTEIVSTTQYYDRDLANGTYTYTVTAQYAEGESKACDAVQVTVATKPVQAPTQLEVRQKGYNNALAIWSNPNTNFTECNYYGAGTNAMDGFGGGTYSFETATRFSAEQMNLFEGYRVTAVSFVPKSEQGSWLVNLYTYNNGKLTLLGSQIVNQELEYDAKNIVKLTRPITLQKDHELLVGIQTNVTNESYDVQGAYEGYLKVGYTDLVRMVGENDFYSLTEASGTTYDVTWPTSALLAPVGSETDLDAIDYYEISIDGGEAIQTKDNRYVTDNLSDGTHTIGVAAAYTDGRKSEPTNANVNIAANTNALKAITPKVTNWGSTVIAKWEAPLDDDASSLGYCANQKASKSPVTTADVTVLKARVDFPASLIKTYLGYEINSVMFYPLSNASFYVEVYENDECIASADAEEITVDSWNTINIDPVTIQKGKTYRYVLTCYDCPVDEAPLAIDGVTPKTGNSSYIQAGGESGWYTIDEETALKGSWLMLINVSDPEAEKMNVDGYDVYVDGEKQASQQSALAFYHEMPELDDNTHVLRVDTKYAGVQNIVAGNNVSFKLDATGIVDVNVNNNTNPNIYNILGQKVSNSTKGIVIVNGKKMLK